MNHSILAISPIDGRYQRVTSQLQNICSEFGLNKYRTQVEVKWFKHLANQEQIDEVHQLSDKAKDYLDSIINDFSTEDGLAIKDIEKTTNHDVKAVEYFLKNKFAKNNELSPLSEFIHFACTSEDINNLAYALMLKDAIHLSLLPQLENILAFLKDFAKEHAELAMLSRTHGQSASPTTLGKEFANIAHRLAKQIQSLQQVRIEGKMNGATGNFNAHTAAYPEVDWLNISEDFIS